MTSRRANARRLLVCVAAGATACAPRTTTYAGEGTDFGRLASTPGRLVESLASATRNARIVIDDRQWIDIAVSGSEEPSAQLCEIYIKTELRDLHALPLSAKVEHPCSADPLPPVASRAGSFLFIQYEDNEELGFDVPMQLDDPDLVPPEVTRLSFIRYPTRDACERALAQMLELRKHADVKTEATTREFLKRQRELENTKANQRCGGVEQARIACFAAKTQQERVRRCTELEDETRGCEMARARVDVIDTRLAGNLAPQRKLPECRAEWAAATADQGSVTTHHGLLSLRR